MCPFQQPVGPIHTAWGPTRMRTNRSKIPSRSSATSLPPLPPELPGRQSPMYVRRSMDGGTTHWSLWRHFNRQSPPDPCSTSPLEGGQAPRSAGVLLEGVPMTGNRAKGVPKTGNTARGIVPLMQLCLFYNRIIFIQAEGGVYYCPRNSTLSVSPHTPLCGPLAHASLRHFFLSVCLSQWKLSEIYRPGLELVTTIYLRWRLRKN